MTTCAQFERREKQAESLLTPELKEFIDCAIVPILVKQFFAEQAAGRGLDGVATDVQEFPGKPAA